MSIQKNSDGHLGPVCNNCGGYGYTGGIRGPQGCMSCDQTGIKTPTRAELQQQIDELRLIVEELRGAKCPS